MLVNEGRYQWRHSEGLLTFFPQPFQIQTPLKLAGFDLDGTLIRPLPGRHQFDRDPANWKWQYPNVPAKLQELGSRGFTIVIFTNQGGWSSKTVAKEGSVNKLVQKLGNIMKALLDMGIIPLIYGALGKGDASPYRKPKVTMYEQFLLDTKTTRSSMSDQFFCGDAAARAGDHSGCDREFAINIGVCFFLPEEVFGIATSAPTVSNRSKVSETTDSSLAQNVSPSQELILTVGYPGSGKTTYLDTYYRSHPNYRIISQDVVQSGRTRSTRPIGQVLSEVQTALSNGLSVVVDRTHMTRESRAPFLEMARSFPNVSTKIMWFNLDLESSYVRNATRNEQDPLVPKVPKIVYYKMRKSFEEPTLDETPNIIKMY